MCRLQSDWSESSDRDDLITSLVLKWEDKQLDIRFDGWTVWWMRTSVSVRPVMLSAVIHIYFLLTWKQQHQLRHVITTSFWLLWLADCSLSVFLSNPEACPRPPLTASLRTAGNTGSLLWYQLCLVQYCWDQQGLTPPLYWPHSLQAAVWTLHKIEKKFHW